MFTEQRGKVRVECRLSGFKNKNTLRGFHIHESGDLRFSDATGCCAHFNPTGEAHGGRTGRFGPFEVVNTKRHVGDLGNIYVDGSGYSTTTFTDSMIALRGSHNIIGRSVVIHEHEDDLGKTNHPLSSTTGNSGARVAAGVIGYASVCDH